VSLRPAGFVPGRHPIDAYGNGGFRFAGMSHRGSILALPSGIYALSTSTVDDLSRDALSRLFAERADIDIVLMGMGGQHGALSEPIGWLFREAGLAVDPMTTGAAARTYNILLAEQRRVAAALIAVA
jgi:uncharacterized protein